MIERTHLAIDEFVTRRNGFVLAVALLTVLATLPVLALRTSLDMSFRPLFSHEPVLLAATAEYEARFGQSSGAQVAVLLERGTAADSAYLRDVGRLAAAIGALPHVSEVLEPGSQEGMLADGDRLALLLARLDLPLHLLEERRAVISALRQTVAAWQPLDVTTHFSGLSVVEAEYADAIPPGMALSLLITTTVVIVVLLALFRSLIAVGVCLAGVTVAVPLAIAIPTLAGRPITMLVSMAPTVILVVGVADAIHMLRRWHAERHGNGAAVTAAEATSRMMAAMALPCVLTTATTAAGFLALYTARVPAIRDFAGVAAAGVVIVYLANILLVPALLHRYGARVGTTASAGSGRSHRRERLMALPLLRPVMTSVGALAVTVALAAGLPRLSVDQRVNEELPPSHPVRTAQALLEREFGGFLGPDLEVWRVVGGSILDADALQRVRLLVADIRALPQVDGVERIYMSERIALQVRIGDVGTSAALALADTVSRLAAARLGASYRHRVVGQWWLAQLGTASLLRDMLVSFITSALLVLPILALALRSWRLLLVAVPANLLPMLAALAAIGWSGITLRVGTALVLAIAFAIAVDDSIHLLVRAHEERQRGAGPRRAMRTALAESGVALAATTLVLVAGFLSMLTSDLAAIRDMGVVAAIALIAALLADLLLLPALYVLLEPRSERLRNPAPAHTSIARSHRRQREARLTGKAWL